MSDAEAWIVGIGLGLALALVLGASLRRRRRPRLSLVPRPSDGWTDAELERLYAGVMGDEETDEHEGAFV